MHAFLLAEPEIYKSTNLQISNLATKHKAKQLPFEMQKIDDVRALRKLVKLTFSQKTAIVIQNIDTATIEAQNAFLKNLEEPQENLIYILTASNINNVLPTIQSRCEIIQIRNPKNDREAGYSTLNKLKIQILKFQTSDINYKFEHINKIKDRGEALEFVKNLTFFDHQENNFDNQENYLHTLKNLKANGNVALQLSNMLVKMK